MRRRTTASSCLRIIRALAILHQQAAILLYVCAISTIHLCILAYMRCDAAMPLRQPTCLLLLLGSFVPPCLSVLQIVEFPSRHLYALKFSIICASVLLAWRSPTMLSRISARLRFCALTQPPFIALALSSYFSRLASDLLCLFTCASPFFEFALRRASMLPSNCDLHPCISMLRSREAFQSRLPHNAMI